MNPLDHRVADGSSRAGVLKVLRDHGDMMRVEDLAESVTLSLSAVRFHLDRLIADGLVRTAKEPRRTPGRPRVMYQAVPMEAVDDGAAYRRLAALLAVELSGRGGAAAAENAGRTWAREVLRARRALPAPAAAVPPVPGAAGSAAVPSGRAGGVPASRRRVDAVARAAAPDSLPEVLAVLEDGGFAPRVVDSGWAVELHRCPFSDLMPEQSEVVCSVHRGLIQSLPELAGACQQVQLESAPDRSGPCMVHFVR